MRSPFTHNLVPALSADAMREADRLTIEEIGIPGFTLMESAGRATVACMEDRYGPLSSKHIGCFCGKGNNGGDALVVARKLATTGARLTVYLVATPESLSTDATRNFKILKHLTEIDPSYKVAFEVLDDALDLSALPVFDIIVDGLLGTGVTRNLSEHYRRIVAWMNQQKSPVVALDLPTGLQTDTGAMLGDAVFADLTVTMGGLKSGLLLGQGPACTGTVRVVEMGIPEAAIAKSAAQFECAHVVTREAVSSWLPKREPAAHKYSVGLSLVVAGSRGLTGAATLASEAASKSGAGAVVCATSAEVQDILAVKMTEVMTLGLPFSDTGIQTDSALHTLDETLARAYSLLVGCGMGKKPDTRKFIRKLVLESKRPTVIDADGLNAFANHTDLITAHANGQWILTPHLGEFKRSAGDDVDTSDRVKTVQQYAKAWNCVLVLKGSPTVVGSPEGRVFINPFTNPAFATAGTGDVLAGLCAGLLAQGLSPVHAALCALFIGGAGADRYVQHHSPLTLLASDLIEQASAIIDNLYS